MNWDTLVTSKIVGDLGWTLLHSLWQLALVAGVFEMREILVLADRPGGEQAPIHVKAKRCDDQQRKRPTHVAQAIAGEARAKIIRQSAGVTGGWLLRKAPGREEQRQQQEDDPADENKCGDEREVHKAWI